MRNASSHQPTRELCHTCGPPHEYGSMLVLHMSVSESPKRQARHSCQQSKWETSLLNVGIARFLWLLCLVAARGSCDRFIPQLLLPQRSTPHHAGRHGSMPLHLWQIKRRTRELSIRLIIYLFFIKERRDSIQMLAFVSVEQLFCKCDCNKHVTSRGQKRTRTLKQIAGKSFCEKY